jgi:serine/threonine protein kinase
MAKTIDPRFEGVTLVARGAMGCVYRAWDLVTAAPVAIKTPGVQLRERFMRESAILASLSHPNIVRHVASGKGRDGTPWMAMEWLDGEDLDARLSRGRLTMAQGLRLARPIATTLAWAHGRRILHRDLKPSNPFLVGRELDRVKVLDFGLARPTANAELTATGMFMGTLEYMPPEQRVDAKRADTRSDVYSLGAVLHHALLGEPPAPSFAADLRRQLPPPLASLVTRMLAPDREERPRDGAAVVAALDDIESVWDAPTERSDASDIRALTPPRVGPTGTVVMPRKAR